MELYFGFGIVCNKSESLNVTSAVSCIESGENRIPLNAKIKNASS
jgi:hypothetical protein